MLTNSSYAHKWEEFFIPNYGTPSIVLSHGEGSYVWDIEGNRYLDLIGGIAVSVLGHGHAGIAKAIADQSKKLIHTSNLYMHTNAIELAEKLVNLFGSPSKVFFSQDGATANEAALKLVRKHGYKVKPDGSKQVIVAMENGFHGRTTGALAITGNPSKRNGFEPFGYEVRFVKYNNLKELESAMKNDVAGIFVEPVQGEGGMNVATSEFLQKCQSLASEVDALFIVDEVQSAVGRTGSFFSFTDFELSPDIVTLAKGIAGGLPLGVTMVKPHVANLFSPGDHGSTFGGNPVSTAAALVVIDEVSQTKFLEQVRSHADWFANELVANLGDKISQIRYKGLWFGIELNSNFANELTAKLQDKGFLVNAVKPNVIRLAPPLNISQHDLSTFVQALKKLM